MKRMIVVLAITGMLAGVLAACGGGGGGNGGGGGGTANVKLSSTAKTK